MTAEDFSKDLAREMDAVIMHEDTGTLEGIKNRYTSILNLVNRLTAFITNYQFKDKKEEADYFKRIKPAFVSKLLYYQKLFLIRSRQPVGMAPDILSYYLTELNKIAKYIESQNDFLAYYRSDSVLFDEIYFVRKEDITWQSINADCEPGSFTTIYDQKLSKLLAYEEVSAFLIEQINLLSEDVSTKDTRQDQAHNVTWTGSKASLIELLYALQTSGVCNNGAVDVSQMANHFEQLFNVKLGNFYRTFQEIRIRKLRTSFLDQLKESLIRRMDHSDENPRYRQ